MSAVSQKLMFEWIHTITMSSDLIKENYFFEQIEDIIETASIERSRLLIERSSSRVMSSSPSRLTFANKEALATSPEGASIPQSPFKKISPLPASMSPPQQQLSNKELLLQQHSAAQTRNRYLGLLQLRPKASPSGNGNTIGNGGGGNSTSPPNAIPSSTSISDFRSYQPKAPPSNMAALPSSTSQPEAAMYGSNNSILAASAPRTSSGFMYSPITEHLSQNQANAMINNNINIHNNSPSPQPSGELPYGLERRRSNTFKDRTIGDDRVINSDPLGRFTIQRPERKSFGSSFDNDSEPTPVRKGSLIGGYRSYDSLTSSSQPPAAPAATTTPTTTPTATSIEL